MVLRRCAVAACEILNRIREAELARLRQRSRGEGKWWCKTKFGHVVKMAGQKRRLQGGPTERGSATACPSDLVPLGDKLDSGF